MPSQRQKIKGVIFDLDGTIIDSLETFTEAFNRGIKVSGLAPVTGERLAYFLDQGFRLGEILLESFPSVFEEDGRRQACIEEIRKAYAQELAAQKVRLKPGVKRVLQSLRGNGVKIGIVTGRTITGELKWRELRRLNINQFIDAMVTGAEAPPKPAPDGLINCIKELGLSAGECVFVGDSRVDVIAGQKAGVRTIAVHTGVAGKELLAEQRPDHVLADLSLLLPCLSELQKAEEG